VTIMSVQTRTAKAWSVSALELCQYPGSHHCLSVGFAALLETVALGAFRRRSNLLKGLALQDADVAGA
jgi:hypothetical protein